MSVGAWCRRAALHTFLCVVLGSLGVITPWSTAQVTAQEPLPESLGVPTKYGHVFVPAPMARSPFVRTAMQNSLGLGQAFNVDFGTITLPSGDTLLALNGDLTLAVLDFEYAYALREWLGVWGHINVGARVGNNVGALLSSGVTLSTSFEIGWLAQVRETDRSLLSASLNVTNSSFTLVDLPRWIEDLIAGETANLVRSTPAMRVGAGLHYAWVLNDLIGFTATGHSSFGEALQDRENQWYFTGSGSISLNFRQRYGVPLGLGFTLKADSYPAISGEQTRGWQGLGLRIAYTGRDNIMIGLTSTGQRVPFREDDHMIVAVMAFDMRYFF